MKKNHTVDTVIDNLKQANFDPEFYTTYEKEIKHAFKKDHSNLITANNG